MKKLKVTTFNAEWMCIFFAKKKAKILNTFRGGKVGVAHHKQIKDVKSVCRRIGRMFHKINADIIAIPEGPQLKSQMELFVKEYMRDKYNVYTQSEIFQNIHVLVRKSIGEVKQLDYDGSEMKKFFRRRIYYYPWGEYTEEKMKWANMQRVPVIIELIINNKRIIFVAVHTKSKFSKLKNRSQWLKRDKVAILDALNARQKLSAQMIQIRDFLNCKLRDSHGNQPLVVMGDFNDGPFADVMEAAFLSHNIIDEIQGSLLEPSLRLFHTMSPETIMTSHSARFKDPFDENKIAKVLIDHILVSRGISERTGYIAIAPNSAKVEYKAYNENNDETQKKRARELRPSDHIPVSVTMKIYKRKSRSGD
jgi:exonuclease III